MNLKLEQETQDHTYTEHDHNKGLKGETRMSPLSPLIHRTSSGGTPTHASNNTSVSAPATAQPTSRSSSTAVKLMNILTKNERTIYTCEEETVGEIKTRYMEYNKHLESYTWKALVNA
jgi:hypothetical protein